MRLIDRLTRDGIPVGSQELTLDLTGGRFLIRWIEDGNETLFGCDGRRCWKQSGERVERLSPVAAKLTPQILQAVALIAPSRVDGLDPWGTATLDGSDKARGQLATRLKITDAQGDWLYCWLSAGAHPGDGSVLPLRISPDLDPSDRPTTVAFDRWQPLGSWHVPAWRGWVCGLEEQVALSIELQSADIVEQLDPRQFERPQRP